jgi:hypothetical protein
MEKVTRLNIGGNDISWLLGQSLDGHNIVSVAIMGIELEPGRSEGCSVKSHRAKVGLSNEKFIDAKIVQAV